MPAIRVEMWLGGAWVDLVALERVDFEAAPVSITRGRANEVAQMEPGQCTFVLVNDDGAFTPDLSTSAYRDSLTLHRPVRVLVQQPDTSWSTRFVGVVDDDTVTLDDETGATSRVTVTCVDQLALMGLKQLKSQRDERIRALGPRVHYPLDEPSGALQANDLAGIGPRLLPTTFGTTEGGTLEFGATGGPISTEGSGAVGITRASTVDGVYLLSTALPTLGAEFTVISIQNPTTSGTVWQLTQDSLQISLYYDATADKYKVRQYNGSAWATLATTSATVSGLHVEVVTISATQVVLRSDATHTAGTRAAGTFTSPTLRIGRGSNTGSGYENMMSGVVAGFAIIPGLMDMPAADTLATALVSPPAITTDDYLELVLGWAGMPQTVGWLGDHPSLGYVPTINESPQGLADIIGQGANGRYVCLRDGSLSWVDRSYVPTLTELGADVVNPGLRWARDRAAYVTEVTTTLPSGGSYTYAAASTALVSQSKSITGVLAGDQACKDAAAFIVSGSSLTPRLSAATIDLLTQPDDATITAVLGLDIGSLVALTGLPPQIPDAQVLVVEGMTEAIGGTVWTVGISTSPSSVPLPPEGWYFAWVDGETTYVDDGLAHIANM